MSKCMLRAHMDSKSIAMLEAIIRSLMMLMFLMSMMKAGPLACLVGAIALDPAVALQPPLLVVEPKCKIC